MRRSEAARSMTSALNRYFLLCSLAFAATIAGAGANAAELTFDLRVENGRVAGDMRVVRVKQGDVVTLRWTADQPAILHLHGYDIEKRVEPGAVVEMHFTAAATGRFPVHAHATGARPGNSVNEEAPLAYVEVYPR
jgi:FtsP/CotA-like multicopper oxidase with cupredoxin domain